MSEEFVHTVLELTITEADQATHQRLEAEADMENVLQWMAGIHTGSRRITAGHDAITLDLRL
jgi:hypothetical protein